MADNKVLYAYLLSSSNCNLSLHGKSIPFSLLIGEMNPILSPFTFFLRYIKTGEGSEKKGEKKILRRFSKRIAGMQENLHGAKYKGEGKKGKKNPFPEPDINDITMHRISKMKHFTFKKTLRSVNI